MVPATPCCSWRRRRTTAHGRRAGDPSRHRPRGREADPGRGRIWRGPPREAMVPTASRYLCERRDGRRLGTEDLAGHQPRGAGRAGDGRGRRGGAGGLVTPAAWFHPSNGPYVPHESSDSPIRWTMEDQGDSDSIGRANLGDSGGMAKRWVGLLLALAAALPSACNGTRLCLPREVAETGQPSPSRQTARRSSRPCVPGPIAESRNWIDLCGEPDAHVPVPSGVAREVEEVLYRFAATRSPPGGRPMHFLALSSGGLQGSFGVGVLNGWTKSGTRPTFDVVTGVSVGSLMATFAFLGPKYDDFLRESLVGNQRRDLFRTRSVLAVLCSDSVYSPAKLKRRIEEGITPQVLCEVAQAHAEGRRLYLGTTNLDRQGLVLWDMGAIASRGTPEALELYRKIVLASASVPGVLPPVELPVEIDGKAYTELHVDGAASDQVIFRQFMVADLNRLAGADSAYAPPGSRLYVVNNGKLYPDAGCVRRKVLPILAAASSSVLYNKTRDEMHRLYLVCLTSGIEFQL